MGAHVFTLFTFKEITLQENLIFNKKIEKFNLFSVSATIGFSLAVSAKALVKKVTKFKINCKCPTATRRTSPVSSLKNQTIKLLSPKKLLCKGLIMTPTKITNIPNKKAKITEEFIIEKLQCFKI